VAAHQHLVAAHQHVVAAHHHLVAAHQHSNCIRYALTSVLFGVQLRTAEKQVCTLKMRRCQNGCR